jgi:DNA-binding IclR family transcriptional regulator
MRRLREANSYSIRAIERAIQILNCFSFYQKEHTMKDLAKMTNLSKSTVFRLLQTLEKNKFIFRDPSSNKYSLGMKLFELGGIIFSTLSLRKAASRFLDQLETKVNHIVLLGILEEGELVYIDRREGNDPFTFTSEIGKRRPPHFGMLGKTLMAFLSEDEIDDLLKRYPLQKYASRSITNPKKFKTSLKEIRGKGYICEYNEAWEGVIGIAAPIRNYLGKVVAAVGTALTALNARSQEVKQTTHLITETAQRISEAMGYNEDSMRS